MIAYEQVVVLKDRIKADLEKQNICVTIKDPHEMRYEKWGKFSLEIEVDMHEDFITAFILMYGENDEVPFFVRHGVYMKRVRVFSEDTFLKRFNRDINQQYKIIEEALWNWIKEQPTLRLQCLCKEWLTKHISIKRIEERWGNKNENE